MTLPAGVDEQLAAWGRESCSLGQLEAVEPKWGKEGLQRRLDSRASESEILNGVLKHQSGGG